MRRHTFALSWGRKIFFGFGWIFFSLLALSYLQTKILPQSTSAWIYFVTTFIGHYGLMTAVLYFIFYKPVIWLLPSYYVSRFWSLFLILVGGLYILLDSIVFSQYRYHLNGFILDLIFSGSKNNVINIPTISYVMLVVGIIVFSLIFWLRGERVWRVMQGRFSNPNSNWYLVLIVVCLITGHSIHMYSKATGNRSVTTLAQLFPLYYPASANKFLNGKVSASDTQSGKKMDDFYYPAKKLECQGEDNKNVLMIVLDGWTNESFDSMVTPELAHLAKHGTFFNNHFSGGLSKNGSLFSLFYSLPATYWDIASETGKTPVLVEQMVSRNYVTNLFTSSNLLDSEIEKTLFSKLQNKSITANNREVNSAAKSWIKSHKETSADVPFLGVVLLDANKDESKGYTDTLLAQNDVDSYVGEILHEIYLRKFLDDTIVVITSNLSASPASKTPMIVVWPDKKAAQVENVTSHYDFVPTLMQELWSCSNKTEQYSYGQNLYRPAGKDWLLVADNNEYDILDFNTKLITQINPHGSYSVMNFNMEEEDKVEARKDLIFGVLKDLIRFTKK